MSFEVTNPFPVFTDLKGEPLENGKIFIGISGLNPETNPVSVFFDADLSVPTAQPIRTIGGYPSRDGTPSELFVSASDFSITVRNKNNKFVFSKLGETGNVLSINSINLEFATDITASDLSGFLYVECVFRDSNKIAGGGGAFALVTSGVADGGFIFVDTSGNIFQRQLGGGSLTDVMFGAVGTGDEQAKVLALLNAAHPRKQITQEITIGSGMIPTGSFGSIIDFTETGRLIPTFAGRVLSFAGAAPSIFENLTANTLKGSDVLTMASTTAFTVGDWVRFESTSTALRGPNIFVNQIQDIARVVGITATTVTLDRGVLYDFNTADAAKVGVATVQQSPVIRNYRCGKLGTTVTDFGGLRLEFLTELDVHIASVENSRASGAVDGDGDGVFVANCVGGEVRIDNMSMISRYGILIGGVDRSLRFVGGEVSHSRHLFTTAGSAGAKAEAIDIDIVGFVSRNSTLSGFDTHSQGDNINFIDCASYDSGDDGLQMRTHGKVINFHSERSVNDGIGVEHEGINAEIVNFTCRNPGRALVNSFSKNLRITNIDGSGAGQAGIASVGGHLIGGLIIDCNIVFEQKKDLSGNYFSMLLEGLEAPQSANQIIFARVLTANGDLDKFRVHNCRIIGYTSNLIFNSAVAGNGVEPDHSGNILDEQDTKPKHGIAVLVAGTASVTGSAYRRQVAATGARPFTSQITGWHFITGGTRAAIRFENVTEGSFNIISDLATDTSTIKWTIDH